MLHVQFMPPAFMPITDIEKKREYDRIWARNKRAGLPTRTTPKSTCEERRTKTLLRRKRCNKTRRQRIDEKINHELGTECVICRSKNHLICHRKNGLKHEKGKEFVYNHMDEFVRVCLPCHKPIHWVMKYFNMSWEEIISKVKEHP